MFISAKENNVFAAPAEAGCANREIRGGTKGSEEGEDAWFGYGLSDKIEPREELCYDSEAGEAGRWRPLASQAGAGN